MQTMGLILPSTTPAKLCRAIAVGAAFSATMLCSCRTVSNRPLSELIQPIADRQPSTAKPKVRPQTTKASQPGIARAVKPADANVSPYASRQTYPSGGQDIILTGATVETAHAVQPGGPGQPQATFTAAEPRVP